MFQFNSNQSIFALDFARIQLLLWIYDKDVDELVNPFYNLMGTTIIGLNESTRINSKLSLHFEMRKVRTCVFHE